MSSRDLVAGSSLFGTVRRTEVLTAITLLEDTYARELARVLDAPLISVQRIVDALDREGVIVTQAVGGLRKIALNPKYFARTELAALLRRLAIGNQRLLDAVAEMRRRPRRKGKAL